MAMVYLKPNAMEVMCPYTAQTASSVGTIEP